MSRLLTLAVCCVPFLFSGELWGQQLATIRGVVQRAQSDSSFSCSFLQTCPNAQVTAQSQAGGVYRTVTDAEGKYVLQNLPAGTYTLTASKNGFISDAEPDPQEPPVSLAAGQNLKVDFELASTLVAVTSDRVITSGRAHLNGRQSALLRYFKQPGPRRGVLLIVFGAGPVYSPCETSNAQRARLESDSLEWALGFDVYYLVWCDSTDYLQRNALVLMDLISEIAGSLSPQERFVIQGRSMGGIISRYALTRMEAERISHDVDLYMSLDAPQMGAYVSVGAQAAADFFRSLLAPPALLASGLNLIKIPVPTLSRLARLRETVPDPNKPSGKQLLIHHYNDLNFPDGLVPSNSRGPNPERTAFVNELASLGDHPKASGMRTVAIANGGSSGRLTTGIPNYVKWTTTLNDGLTVPIALVIDGKVLWNSGVKIQVRVDWIMEVHPVTRTGVQRVFRFYRELHFNLNGLERQINTIEDVVTALKDILKIPAFVPLDSVVLPAAAKILQWAKAFPTPSIVEHSATTTIPFDTVSAGLDTSAKELEAMLNDHGVTNGNPGHDVLIPTTSALGLDLPPGTDLSRISALSSPRFQQIYHHNRDTDHLSPTDEIRGWLCQENHRLLGLPYIARLDPERRPARRAGFTLDVYGGNFTSTTVVAWNGRPRTTRYVSSSRLAVNIDAVDIALADTDGLPISIVNSGAVATGCPVPFFIDPNPLRVSPAQPTTEDDINFILSEDNQHDCVPGNPSVSRSGNVIQVNTTSSAEFCVPVLTPFTVSVGIGRLPAGTYDLVVMNRSFFLGQAGPPQEIGRLAFSVNRPAPSITAVSPTTIPAAGPGLSLRVFGSNFVPGVSTVLWNGVARPTVFQSAAELLAQLSAADVANQGTVQVSVSTAAALPDKSGSLPFVIGAPVPILSQLEPAAAVSGSQGILLRLQGSNFTAGALVSWGTTRLSPRFINSSTLELVIRAADVRAPGNIPIAVISEAGVTTAALNFVVMEGTPGQSTLLVSHADIRLESTAGFAGSASETVFISSSSGTLNVEAAVDGGNWLAATPNQAAAGPSPAETARIIISANAAGLPIGVYTATLRLFAQGVPAVAVPVSLTVRPNRFAITQIADGGEWKTTIILTNLGTGPVTATTSFFSPTGEPKLFGIRDVGSRTDHSVVIPIGGSHVFETQGTSGVVRDGWAEVNSDGPISGRAVFRQRFPNGKEWEAAVPLSLPLNSPLLPFDNSGGFATGMALLNSSSQPASVTLLFRSADGEPISTERFTLPPRTREAYMLPDRFPAVAEKSGVLELISTGGEIHVLGLRFSPRNSFTSFEPVPQLASGGGTLFRPVSQIADGGGWKTTLVLVNNGAEPAPFTLNFKRPDGTPLSVPVDSYGDSSTISGLIPIRGSQTIETAGSSPNLLDGWAEILSSETLGGTTVFRQRNSDGTDSEAVIQIAPSPGTRFVLPFDNTQGFLTGVAALNDGVLPATATITFRDEQGVAITAQSLTLDAGNRRAFFLPDLFTATAGLRGTAEFDGAAMAILGLRFNPSGPFTSVAPSRK